jgi:hypothetical protein
MDSGAGMVTNYQTSDSNKNSKFKSIERPLKFTGDEVFQIW